MRWYKSQHQPILKHVLAKNVDIPFFFETHKKPLYMQVLVHRFLLKKSIIM